jgi:hypothetical protein
MKYNNSIDSLESWFFVKIREKTQPKIENKKKIDSYKEIDDVEFVQNNAFCSPDSLLCSPHCIP